MMPFDLRYSPSSTSLIFAVGTTARNSATEEPESSFSGPEKPCGLFQVPIPGIYRNNGYRECLSVIAWSDPEGAGSYSRSSESTLLTLSINSLLN